MNTTSLIGTTGSLDFNFNPGPLVTQSAYAEILNLIGGGVSGAASLTGNASGSLPGTVTLDNGAAFNDYFQGFTYGSSLMFQVSLYGPALSAPNGTASSGSTFAFSLFSDLAGTVPAFTTDTTDGFGYLIDVNLDGSTTVTNYLYQTTAVPEPSTLGLVVATSLSAFVARAARGRAARPFPVCQIEPI